MVVEISLPAPSWKAAIPYSCNQSMPPYLKVAQAVGLAVETERDVEAAVRRGLAPAFIDVLADMGVTPEDVALFVGQPEATRLSPADSLGVLRAAESLLSTEWLLGSRDRALAWLCATVLPDGRRPIEEFANPTGQYSWMEMVEFAAMTLPPR